jgi:REP element-mobilizing transposase RayT
VPRKLRENEPGGIYHVFARGNNRELIYRDDKDRRLYLNRLEATTTRLGWRGLSYCLMDNHVHLLIETPEPNLSEGMRFLQGGYAQVFNRRHGRVGHVFQGRYGAIPMRNDGQVCTAAAYIARNPVSAGLCSTPAAWPWSSFRKTVAARASALVDSQRLLEFFDSRPKVARRRFVEMSVAEPYDPSD